MLRWAFAAGVATQGALAFFSVHRLFALDPSDYTPHVALPLGLATGAVGFAARPVVEGSGAKLLVLAALEIGLAAVYFGLLVRLRAVWVAVVVERFFERGS